MKEDRESVASIDLFETMLINDRAQRVDMAKVELDEFVPQWLG